MSSMIAYYSKDRCWIATDTISHTKKENKILPHNYVSKTYYLPHLKACFCGQGYTFLLTQFFRFAQDYVIAKDIRGIINAAKENFIVTLEENITVGTSLGTIFLFGYDEAASEFLCMKLSVENGQSITITEMPLGLIVKPGIPEMETILAECNSYHEIAIELMKGQRKADEIKAIEERVVIGGQVQFTDLAREDESKDVIFQIRMIYNFEDFEEYGNEMLKK